MLVIAVSLIFLINSVERFEVTIFFLLCYVFFPLLILFCCCNSARKVGVERTLGPEGYTQCTAYVIYERGLPSRQVTRTITIHPRETGRPHKPRQSQEKISP